MQTSRRYERYVDRTQRLPAWMRRSLERRRERRAETINTRVPTTSPTLENLDASYQVLVGDCRQSLQTVAAKSVNCCVTSPPYFGLRNYGVDGQLGLEPTIEEYVQNLVDVFREVRRVLKDDGTVWLNLGDSYAGSGRGFGGKNKGKNVACDNIPKRLCANIPTGLKAKDLIGVPWRVAFALQADGWYLRSDIIWNKPSVMPESVTDRPTRSHEHIFLLTKSSRYYYDDVAIQEAARPDTSVRDRDSTKLNNTPGRTKMSGLKTNHYAKRNKRDVWTVTAKPFKGQHFAAFPPDLIEPCILAGCPQGGTVLDCFGGTGTTAGVSLKHGRNAILCELSPDYAAMMEERVESILGATRATVFPNDTTSI